MGLRRGALRPEPGPPPPDGRPTGLGRDAPAAISTLVGVAAAVVLAVLINAIAARHFRRWDATSAGLYTLSEATKETLRALEEPITIHVLMPEGDPLRESLDQLLVSYRSESARLDVRATDPDRAPAELLAIQQRYGIQAGRAEDGRLVSDAAVVIARGDRPHFLTVDDLVDAGSDDRTARPRLEEALTGGIRRLLSGDRPRVCFTEGHGERSIDVAGDDGLALLRDRLVKNNYDVTSVWADGGAAPTALVGCALVVVAGPTLPIPPEHVGAIERFVEEGGSALLVIGPVPREDDRGYVELGDAPLLALAGVQRRADFVFEQAPDRRASRGFGETFLPEVEPHAVTEGLRRASGSAEVVITVASSLADAAGTVAPQRLLSTSPESFGMADFFAWAREPGEPTFREGDRKGPLTIAVAAERPAPPGKPRGARLVVVSSSSVLAQANWQSPDLRGTAAFVEGSFSWLAAHRAFLDLPARPAGLVGLEISEGGLDTVFRSAVLLLPAAAALCGVLVWLTRRRAPRRPGSKSGGGEGA